MKKQYSLALWWWAAIWLLHIWVIKYLEEENININEVSWTSMWAIIASMYAIGKSSEFMQQFANDIKFMKLIDFDLSNWVLKWDKIYKKFKIIFWDIKIEDLDIKLKIVATDIENWEKQVFEEGLIIDAVRASISLPWIFKPHKIDEKYYVDWWIVNNLPVEVLDWKNIIAVSAIKNIIWKIQRKRKLLWFKFNMWFLNLNFQVLQRSLLLMMKQNELTSINHFSKNVLLIKPDVEAFEFYSFNKVNELVEKWYNEAILILND